MWLLGWVTVVCGIVACFGGQLRFPYGDTSFSLSVYKAAFDPDRNIVVAPFVLRNSVVMLYSIATDAVRDKLREVFGLPMNFTEFLTNQKELHYTLGGGGDGFRMKNRIILNGFREVDVHMRDVMKEDLDTAIAYFDFVQREGVVRRVNHFVNFNTNRAVGGIVKIEDIPKHLQMVQVCAASFGPPFASSFDPKDTRYTGDFWSGLIEKLYSTITMFKRGDFRFSRIPELEIEVLELPFVKSSDAVMWIMLPDRDASLEAIMKALEPGHFDAIQAHFSLKRAEITVPLFSIESEFNATEFLQGIGLDVLFKNRDLRVFEDVDSSLDSVLHRAGIRLHEKTADAGGASVVRSFNKRSSMYQYVVARSYLFVVVKKTSKQILFMGHLHKPDDLVEV